MLLLIPEPLPPSFRRCSIWYRPPISIQVRMVGDVQTPIDPCTVPLLPPLRGQRAITGQPRNGGGGGSAVRSPFFQIHNTANCKRLSAGWLSFPFAQTKCPFFSAAKRKPHYFLLCYPLPLFSFNFFLLLQDPIVEVTRSTHAHCERCRRLTAQAGHDLCRRCQDVLRERGQSS
jgi:hypothetical protein